MLRIEFHEAAESELAEALGWYEENERGLGTRFRTEIEKSIDRISQFPRSFPVIHGSTIRRALAIRFPYSIIYRIEEDFVLIISVFHSSRNPIIWKGRID